MHLYLPFQIILKHIQCCYLIITNLWYAYQTIECVTVGLISKTIRSTSGLKSDDAKR